ncbi:hypothetical protein GCM10007939_09110 [Amylibacter marinus]|uniref:SPOR domain-containing protein n=1 Tax=Amylibacter marinus TaxID=1475483 RepID=A0ABQ5VT68_9RHOB|nr:hypothetical protein [Amylibacter marinus]GLQ34628.1 hypothetical protein GCM10007939_09110 [Amylibacter marinus]
MNYSKILFCTAAILISANVTHARALKGIQNPANLPPAGFNGQQYVDNNGCVFVRAGRLGVVNWVPRVDVSRRHICSDDLTPTFKVAKAETPAAENTAKVNEAPPKKEAPKPPEKKAKPVKAKPTAAKKTPKPVTKPKATAPIPVATASTQREKKLSKQELRQLQKEYEQGNLTKAEPAAKLASTTTTEKPAPKTPSAKELSQARAAERAKAQEKAAADRAAKKAARKAEREAKATAAKQAAKSAPAPKSTVAPGFYVEVATFTATDLAEVLAAKFYASGHESMIFPVGKNHRLYVGPFSSDGNAKSAFYQSRALGYGDAKIVSSATVNAAIQ